MDTNTGDTPSRVGKELFYAWDGNNKMHCVVSAEFARALERDLARLTEENAALRKDAERYQFLRDGEYSENLLPLLIKAGIHKNQVDAHIDAAIKEGS